MWRLWHRLFGWDYVVMEAHYRGLFNPGSTRDVIVRVRRDMAGRAYVQYREKIVFLADGDAVQYLTK